LESGLLQAMVEVLNTRPEVEAVMPEAKNINDEGEIIGSMGRVLDLQSPDVFERAHDILVANYQHVVAYGLLRASTLKVMRTGPDYVGWDPVFIWELALRGRIVQVAGPALLRRFHPASISRVKTIKEMRKWVEPSSTVGLDFPHWNWAYERWRALIASPLSMRDRWRIGKFLMRVTIWQRGALVHDVTQAVRRALRLSDEYTF
jgi:hypothetical protein